MCQRVNHGSTTGVPMCGHSRQGAGEGSAANVAPLDRLARGVDAALPGAVALQHETLKGGPSPESDLRAMEMDERAALSSTEARGVRDSTLMLVRGVRPSPSLIRVSARLTRLVGPAAAAAFLCFVCVCPMLNAASWIPVGGAECAECVRASRAL
eukprot:CAMPEP_0198703378 /NCGR_PEP_ID=MMETSP1468-20131203/389310_1 /TAXON_ID=1461545 /ORGANISM="Mantoniella sp, Strain CCMP1436" /LENGTH=154 /DNA_ID=CAMNT_0044462067 /DNA_START=1664 /DNA_END=2129 /DNA_ORIENTATION=-